MKFLFFSFCRLFGCFDVCSSTVFKTAVQYYKTHLPSVHMKWCRVDWVRCSQYFIVWTIYYSNVLMCCEIFLSFHMELKDRGWRTMDCVCATCTTPSHRRRNIFAFFFFLFFLIHHFMYFIFVCHLFLLPFLLLIIRHRRCRRCRTARRPSSHAHHLYIITIWKRVHYVSKGFLHVNYFR